jgi:aryl-alcohol dehydrogenase-like predicted oxidoreductase
MEKRKLGTNGLEVGAIGLGCMPMTADYIRPEEINEAEAIATIHRALERGVTLLDTAEEYGPFTNEVLVGKAIKGWRSRVVVATKFGILGGADGSPATARRVCEESLRRMDLDVIDLYYLHRKDPKVPIEESVGAMADLVKEGKVRWLGLSEVGPETLRRAQAVHPIAALQSEYSLFERGVEAEILPTLRELGIGFVPFSPLGRGFLAGSFKDAADLPETDFRQNVPRFKAENAKANAKVLEVVRNVALRRRVTPAQVALAWILAQGEDIVPIPGTRRHERLDENLDAADLQLTAGDLAELGRLAAMVVGERYLPRQMAMVER